MPDLSSMTTGIVILAAGASVRLGRPKQLLVYGGKTLIQHAVATALETDATPVIVVLGASLDLVAGQIPADPRLQIIHNSGWSEGISASIRTGISALAKAGVGSAIVMLCDQPFITPALLNELIVTRHRTGKRIAACHYGDTMGTPALFDSSMYHELLALTGDQGAKRIILRHPEELASVPFPNGSIDIDTPEDYDNLG